jgi:hypothetical protein
MWLKWLIVIVLALVVAGCNTAKDTADTSRKGGAGAVGVAEKMKSGTVGETDMDSGEAAAADEGY